MEDYLLQVRFLPDHVLLVLKLIVKTSQDVNVCHLVNMVLKNTLSPVENAQEDGNHVIRLD
jgi:hypothetical protein